MVRITTNGDKSPGIVGGAYIDNSVNYYPIQKHFDYFHGLRKVFSSLCTEAYHRLGVKRIDFYELVESYFSQKIDAGQQVTVDGFLSRYVLTHRPDYYAPYTQKASDIRITHGIGKSGQVKLQIDNLRTQIPVQAFSCIEKNSVKKYIYFLYCPDFSSFHLEPKVQEVTQKEDQQCDAVMLNIEPSVQPIVLVSAIDLRQHAQKYVKVTGVVNRFDTDMVKLFSKQLTSTQHEIFSNTFRPFNENVQSLCIDLACEPERCELSATGSIDCLDGTLYAEAHFENIHKIIDIKAIGLSLPDACPGLHWSSFNSPRSDLMCGLCGSDVSIVTSGFVNYAYYIPVDFAADGIFANKLKVFRDEIEKFRKNLCYFYKDKYGISPKHVYDFLFDNEKAFLFHPKGLMSEGEFCRQMQHDSEQRETLAWLKTVAPK